MGSFTFNAATNGADITLPASFTDLANVQFRLYLYGTPDGNEADYVYLTIANGSSIKVDGSAVFVPEPGTYALLGLGLGFLVVVMRSRRTFRA